jgi:hypothetical protein
MVMRRWVSIFFVLVVLAVFSFGCHSLGYYSKETKVKCPKCGAVFSIEEGVKGMGGY